MRLKLDENLPVELADMFREAGHDAVTVLDQGLMGARDSDLASICRREGRMIVTFDTEFADIRTYSPGAYPGLVVFRLDSQARPCIGDRSAVAGGHARQSALDRGRVAHSSAAVR